MEFPRKVAIGTQMRSDVHAVGIANISLYAIDV